MLDRERQMGQSTPRLAKLTRPRLHAATPRPALFHRFDDALGRHLSILVAGPPGAGKTTAVASWLDSRRLPGIWYQVSRDDLDTASLFHYLRIAVAGLAPRKRNHLPVPTADQLKDVARFAGRFFQHLFSSMPIPSALVFDNYHELPSASEVHPLVAGAIEAAPEGVCIICITRADPPEDFGRPLTHGSMLRVGWEDLRLAAAEAAQIARHRGVSDAALVRAMHRHSDGWAAGFTLLLEHGRRDLTSVPGAPAGSEVFPYFAAEVFRSLTQETQDFLLRTADLPSFTLQVAEQLTGNVHASSVLADLQRRQLFVHVTGGAQPVYRYHGLFRQFLLDRASRMYDVESRRALQRRAAALLLDLDLEHAITLLAEAEHWESLAEIIVQKGPSALQQGRWRSVQDWVRRLPRRALDEAPWVRYWSGVALAAVDVMAARNALEQAYCAFRQVDDKLGQMLCAAEILRAFFVEFRSFERVDPWIDALGELVDSSAAVGSPDQELRIYSALLGALASTRTRHPMIERCAARTRDLLEDQSDANLVLIAAISLVFYSSMAGRVRLAEEAASVVRPHLDAESLSPVLKIFWLGSYGYVRYIASSQDEAVGLFEQAEQLAEEQGLTSRINFIRAWHAYCLRRMGNLEGAERLGRRIEQSAQDAGARRNVMWLRGLNERSRGNLQAAVKLGAEALGGVRHSECTLHGAQHLQQAEMLLEAGDLDGCREWLEEARHRIEGTFSESAWSAVVLAIEALLALRAARVEECTDRLRPLIALAADDEASVFLPWFRYTMSQLLPIALEHRILPEAAQALIRRLRIAPARPHVHGWPWQVRIYALGDFRVLVDDKPLSFPRKTPRRLLLLLKLLVAACGRPVPVHRIADALYPDELGDASAHALDAALHRLRRLLGSSDAVRASSGHVSLDQCVVWTDVGEFEQLLSGAVERPEWTDHALRLYGGEFLTEEPNAPWAISVRERLRGKLLYHVEQRGKVLEAAGSWQEAMAAYLQGIDADPLSEACYQGLMRSYAAQDRRAEALSAYRRLRQQLSIVLGIGPSRHTEALARELRVLHGATP
jgi:LuxR family transcriptional regulator, maltose regulon positive regulatory protein